MYFSSCMLVLVFNSWSYFMISHLSWCFLTFIVRCFFGFLSRVALKFWQITKQTTKSRLSTFTFTFSLSPHLFHKFTQQTTTMRCLLRFLLHNDFPFSLPWSRLYIISSCLSIPRIAFVWSLFRSLACQCKLNFQSNPAFYLFAFHFFHICLLSYTSFVVLP